MLPGSGVSLYDQEVMQYACSLKDVFTCAAMWDCVVEAALSYRFQKQNGFKKKKLESWLFICWVNYSRTGVTGVVTS